MNPSLSEGQKRVKEEIAKHVSSIRKKYLSLKKADIQSKHDFSDIVQPITQPLEQLVTLSKDKPHHDEMETTPFMDETPVKHYKSMLESHYGRVSGDYIQKLVQLRPRNVDTVYGIKWHPDRRTFSIGALPISIKNDVIYVDNKRFQARRGLMELLTKSMPDPKVYTERDLEMYKDILERSSAHKVGYDDNEEIRVSNSQKFKNVIRALFPDDVVKVEDDLQTQKPVRGKGLWKRLDTNRKIDYKYWDDPNELVHRLRLLVASSEAGNHSHNNEILEIITELRESGVIQ